MKNEQLKKLCIAGMLVALCVACSPFSFPVGASRCFPIQHIVNIISSVVLGPVYAISMAFATSLIRNLIGAGTLLAFPGSMCGAFVGSMLYKCCKKLPLAYVGEVFGTAIVGGLLAFPVAKLIMGNNQAVILGYIIPFGISTLGGTIIAIVVITAVKRTKSLSQYFVVKGKDSGK